MLYCNPKQKAAVQARHTGWVEGQEKVWLHGHVGTWASAAYKAQKHSLIQVSLASGDAENLGSVRWC